MEILEQQIRVLHDRTLILRYYKRWWTVNKWITSFIVLIVSRILSVILDMYKYSYKHKYFIFT